MKAPNPVPIPVPISVPIPLNGGFGSLDGFPMTQLIPGSGRKIDSPPLNVVLVEPQIPPNTGNIARLCAAGGCHLILAGALGFRLDDATLKRAGLDYWEHVSWEHRPDFASFFNTLPPGSFHLFSARATKPYTAMPVTHGDYLIFGKETAGLPKSLLERYPGNCYTIPMFGEGVRSLNLSSAAAIGVYDALRRMNPHRFAPPDDPGGKGPKGSRSHKA